MHVEIPHPAHPLQARQILVGLGQNISLLLSAALLFGLLLPRLHSGNRHVRGALLGLFFGVIALLGMFLPVRVMEGVTIDGRVVVVAVAAFFGGPIATVLAAALPIGYRIHLGGIGMAPGVGAIVGAALCGALVRRLHGRALPEVQVSTIALLGLATAVQALLWTFALPKGMAWPAVREYLLPVLLIYPTGVALLTTLLAQQEQRHLTAARLREEVARQATTALSLSESEARLRALAEHIQEVFWVRDPRAQKLLYVSPAYEQIWGCPAADLYTRPNAWLDQVKPEHREHVLAATSGDPPYEFEFELTRPDGETRWIRNRAFPVLDEKGQLVRIVGFAENITARKAIEDDLRAHDEQMSAIVQHSVDGLCVAVDGRIRLVNPAFLRMLDRQDDLIGQPQLDWVSEAARPELERMWVTAVDPAAATVIKDARANGERALEVRLVRYGVSKSHTLFLVRDVTYRERMEEQLRQAQKMEAIGRLAGGVAHDFNNILTVILGNAADLLRQLEHDGAMAREVAEIEAAGQQAAALTQQLLAFSRKQVQQPKVLALGEGVREASRLLGRLLGRGIAVDLRTEDEESAYVLVDPNHLQQIVMNLGINARDAMKMKSGGRLTLETRVVDAEQISGPKRPTPAGQRLALLAVSDTGAGMDEATLSRLFEPFFTTKPTGQGTGLGLATVHGIVRQAGGFIEAASTVGAGSRFEIYLPIVAPPTAGLRAPQTQIAMTAEQPTLLAQSAATVLVVEDGESLRRLIVRALRRDGLRVLEASTGREAIEVAREHAGEIALLLTDVVMPGLSGRLVAAAISAQRPDMKVVFMSGNIQDETLEAAVARNEVRLIQKPFDLKTLLTAVRPLLERPHKDA